MCLIMYVVTYIYMYIAACIKYGTCSHFALYCTSNAAGLEFIYAQSPEQMKGFLTGLFYLVFGLFSGAASVFFLCYPNKFTHFHNFVWYFTIYTVIGCIGWLMYVLVACLYSNRDRPEEEDFD